MKKGSKQSEEAKIKNRISHLGKITSDETKKKLSEANKRNGHCPPSRLGIKHTQETKDKISISNLGKQSPLKGIERSLETKNKIRLGNTGLKRSDKVKKILSNAQIKSQFNRDGNAHKEIIGYRALHYWVESKLGRPRFCEDCGNKSLKQRQYHWANISQNYKRLTTDWRRLCTKCHALFDKDCHRGRPRKSEITLN